MQAYVACAEIGESRTWDETGKMSKRRQTTLLSFIPELKKSKESAGEGKRQALLARQLDSS